MSGADELAARRDNLERERLALEERELVLKRRRIEEEEARAQGRLSGRQIKLNVGGVPDSIKLNLPSFFLGGTVTAA